MTMAMVTARVNAERKRDAEKVLKRNGRTYSDLIRLPCGYGGTAGIRASDALPDSGAGA